MLIFTTLIAAFVVVLVVLSRGDPGPGVEKVFVEIGGVRQGMFIEARDPTRPVLLFVHGGPGMPEYAVSRRYPLRLAEDFVVCWWDQRGAGISNPPGLDPSSVTVEQLVADTIEVTQYLRRRFGQQKIYLLAHSWGTVVGVQAAARAPELYHAYLGMGQVTRQLESEKLSWCYMRAAYAKAGDVEMVRKLDEFPIPELGTVPPAYRRLLRDEAMHKLGVGTTREMTSVVSGIFVPVWTSPIYTLGEKVRFWRGKWSEPSRLLWDAMIAADIPRTVPRLEVPAYFFHGAYDQTTSLPLAKAYYEALDAPAKAFFTFERSAHSPLFEEPAEVRRVLRDEVLRDTSVAAAR